MPAIAVIGGGAKAAALVAKAHALKKLGYAVPDITVFEQHEIGANWTGEYGYTSGDQPLCTPPDNDLGYPYRSDFVDPEVAESTYQNFSWAAYKVSCPEPQEYSAWTDRGRLHTSHAEFAGYLRWAFERAGNTPTTATVIKLIDRSKEWWIEAHNNGDGANYGPFAGVVVTGPGSARRSRLVPRDRFFNGVNFWRSTDAVKKALKSNPTGTVVVYGGGGTAAAVLAWFAREGFSGYQILVLTKQAMLYTRGNNFFERRLFTDGEAWRRLSTDTRRTFVNRLNRGVVWHTMADQIAQLQRMSLIEGEVTSVEKQGTELAVTYQTEKGQARVDAYLAVDATGFDAWWFRSTLPGDWSHRLDPADPSTKPMRERLSAEIGQDLAFTAGWPLPPLHVPMLADLVGPGTTNLLSLGDLADRILRAYIPSTPAVT